MVVGRELALRVVRGWGAGWSRLGGVRRAEGGASLNLLEPGSLPPCPRPPTPRLSEAPEGRDLQDPGCGPGPCCHLRDLT